MKTLVAALTALTLIATPVLAQQRYERQESHEHHRNNEWVAPLVGGLIIGGIIENSTHNNDERYYPPVVQPNLVCENYYVRDVYGNYVLDRYNRAIVQQRCWYIR